MDRLRRTTRRWLPAAVAGAALGVLGWFLVREGLGGRNGSDALTVDLSALRARLRAAGAEDVEVRLMAPGIVELVGRVDESPGAERLLDVASRTPGVEIVVNRLWVPPGEVSRPGRSTTHVESGGELT